MTRKKRALAYIREKNNLRLGGFCVRNTKVSMGIPEADAIKLLRTEPEKLSIKFKLDLVGYDFRVGLVNDDFIKDIMTCRMKIRKL